MDPPYRDPNGVGIRENKIEMDRVSGLKEHGLLREMNGKIQNVKEGFTQPNTKISPKNIIL